MHIANKFFNTTNGPLQLQDNTLDLNKIINLNRAVTLQTINTVIITNTA